ncbi:MAG: hypothetical protein WA610_01885 [Thermodesulfovibrionales bacterium]
MNKIKKILAMTGTMFFGGLLILGATQVFAEMSGMQGHQHKDMQKIQGEGGNNIIAGIKTEPEHITVGTPTAIMFSFKDSKGKPVEGLTIHHDRLIHVIIASQDFDVFAHIHPQDFGPITPEMKKTALYPVRFTFPKAGRYIVGIDFAVNDSPLSKHFVVDVAGEPRMGPTKQDYSRKKRFGGLDVTFATTPERITSGKEVTLSYTFTKNGEPVTKLEPWLSAPMHLAIISGDLTHFIHAHGELPGMPAMGHHEHHMQMKMTVPDKFGPKIEVHAIFPAAGLYQIFGQVGYGSEIITTSYMIRVE